MIRLWALLILLLMNVRQARAYIHEVPGSLAKDVLSESTPTAFPPAGFSTEDFTLEWADGKVPEGVTLDWMAGTLEWVRVAELLVLPRARVSVFADGVEAGNVVSSGFAQALAISEGKGTAVVAVAMISGRRNPIEVTVRKGGVERRYTAFVRFKPRPTLTEERVFFDNSCSPHGLSSDRLLDRDDSWVFVGCRMVLVRGQGHQAGNLEMFVFWDNVGDQLEAGGTSVESTFPSTWTFRLRSKPGSLALKSGSRSVQLRYFVSDPFQLVNIGVGLGPYSYGFINGATDVSSFAPVLTLYGAFFITENTRLVGFDATAIHRSYYTDFGIYLSNESIRLLDRRLSVYLLFGAHAIVFGAEGENVFRIGGPQGIEMVFRDAFKPAYNMSFGAFIYPLIDQKMYYNVWGRYGSRGYFGEFNYIAWQEKGVSFNVFSRSFGITLGMPLVRLF